MPTNNKRIENLESAVKSERHGVLFAVHGLHGPFWTVGRERVTDEQIDEMSKDYAELVKLRIIRGGANEQQTT